MEVSLLKLGKVHADSSTFAADLSKQEVYEQILLQAEALFDGQRNWVRLVLPNWTSVIREN